MRDEVGALLRKAARSFDASEILLGNGDADFAASRAYYGFFYVAESLLLEEGHAFSSHSQVIGQYGRMFAKTGRIESRFHRALMQSFSMRTAADYSTEAGLEDEAVEGSIADGRAFLAAAHDYLEHREAEGTDS